LETTLSSSARKQRTLKQMASFAGIGIHTGEVVQMRFCPAKEGTGIVFKRVDLPSQPIIPATVEYVCDTARSTTLGIGKVRVHTVEHVMAALAAYKVDNLCIELDNIEPPVGNGSSDVFVQMIEKAGIVEQDATRPIIRLQKPISWSEGDIHLAAIPGEGFRISYTLHYPHSPVLKAQYHSLFVT
jgi:UDP-3-O-[3-hydroxymyristoyl] N-acetylglucosamine deacetylase